MNEQEPSCRLLPAMELAQAQSQMPRILELMVAAGNPYYSALYGSSEEALRVLDGWPLRPSSELALSRTWLAVDKQGLVAGLVVALPGGQLKACRNADALALFSTLGKQGVEGLLGRMRQLQGLFMTMEEGDYYLSKLAVAPEYRRQGIGRKLAQSVTDRARQGGYKRVILEMESNNSRAKGLYESLGYRTISQASAESFGFTYLTQAVEL